MKHAIALVLVALFSLSLACSYAQKGCKAIHVADNACHVLVLEDGTTVQLSREDLAAMGRTALARDAGADHD